MLTKSNRRQALKNITMGITAAATMGSLKTSAQNQRPNIIFLLADDLGYGDLGCYGQHLIKTPNLDKMAEEGMRFTDHYAGSTVCAPSRATIMLGLHTGHLRTNGQNQVLQPQEKTVAEYLKEVGYRTACIGKWGLGEEDTTGFPLEQGFDYFFGYLNQVHAHNYYPAFLWRNREKVELENEVKRPERGYAKEYGGAATKRVDYSHDLFTKEALNFIDENKKDPFFLYLPYTIPHANNEHWVVGEHGMEVPDYGLYKNKKDWPAPQKGHAAMITRMDRDVGRIFHKLQELGLDENTLVIFSSDNGPHKEGQADPLFFNSAGKVRGMKRDLYDGGIRVPMIARWPGKIKPGSVSHHISAFWDLLPTFCEAAGIEAPEDIDGISFMPEMLGKKQKIHEILYWEFSEQGGKQSLRWGDWKAVRLNVAKLPEGPLELYNLKNDIREKNNVAALHPDIVEKMEQMIREQQSNQVTR